MRRLRSVANILAATYQAWRADRAIRLGAGLAYYAVFAAVPLVSSAMAIAGVVFTESEINGFLSDRLAGGTLPDEIQSALELVASSIERPSTAGSLGVFGVVVGVVAGSFVFLALQDSLNVIWHLPVQSGLRSSVRRRLVAVGVVVLAGVLLIGALLVQTVVVVVDDVSIAGQRISTFVDSVLVSGATWGLGVVAIAVLFQILTRPSLPWRKVFIVSALTVLLLLVGNWALGIYFQTWGSSSVAGVAGGILILLGWLYYGAQIVIAGAELLKVLTASEGGDLA